MAVKPSPVMMCDLLPTDDDGFTTTLEVPGFVPVYVFWNKRGEGIHPGYYGLIKRTRDKLTLGYVGQDTRGRLKIMKVIRVPGHDGVLNEMYPTGFVVRWEPSWSDATINPDVKERCSEERARIEQGRETDPLLVVESRKDAQRNLE